MPDFYDDDIYEAEEHASYEEFMATATAEEIAEMDEQVFGEYP